MTPEQQKHASSAMAIFWAIVLCLLVMIGTCNAQKNDVSVTVNGDGEPTNFIYLGDKGFAGQPVASWMRSAAGGGAEYRRWFSEHFGVSAVYEQNPSEAKLFVSDSNPEFRVYAWPIMHYDLAVPFTERFQWRKFVPWVQGGPGVVMTTGTGSGFSWNFAFTGGYGFDYPISKRVFFHLGTMLKLAKLGCYDDHTCTAAWAVGQDVRTGIGFNW